MTVRTWSTPTTSGDVTVIEIALPDMRVELLSLGAAIRQVEVPDRSGSLGPVHLALPEVADYADRALNPHLGATLGRYANRIAGGTLELDGTTYHLDVNNGPNTLHGGALGWDRHLWQVADIDDSAEAVTVTFALTSPDGDMGFPGTVSATTTYVMSGTSIALHFSASTDALTVISMAHHGYWNLAGIDTIAGHELQVSAQQRLVMNDVQIPCGIADVAGTTYDLRAPVDLGPVIDATGGLDDCYVVDGHGLRAAALLRYPANGRWLRVSSDAPGVQVYTGNNLKAPFRVHESVSLEAQRMPDAPHQPDLGPCVLRPGEEYRSTTLLEFGVD
ncbi:MAG: aldose epimerase family protein [Candidatus Nanopelagicales bacterium]